MDDDDEPEFANSQPRDQVVAAMSIEGIVLVVVWVSGVVGAAHPVR